MQSRKPSNSDLTVFQHVDDPTRVRTVADKNSAVTPFDLRPTVADQVFKGNSIEVRGQFNCAMNMPSTGCATLPPLSVLQNLAIVADDPVARCARERVRRRPHSRSHKKLAPAGAEGPVAPAPARKATIAANVCVAPH